MRDRLIITVTDLNGSKHFNLHQKIKKIVMGVILFTVASIATGSILINVLINDVSSLKQKREALTELNRDYEQRIDELSSSIEQKSLELKTFSDSLENIETLVGLKESKDLSLQARVDLAKISSAKRHYMLFNIPSGNPLGKAAITGKFGWRSHPVTKKKSFHKGVDLRAKVNTNVNATASGIVEFAGFHSRSGFGNLLIIVHNYGFKSYYAHLNKLKVKSGDIVNKGQLVALTGNTGLSNGPHLHYEVRYVGVSIDPVNFINWDINRYESIFKTTSGIKWQSLINMIAINQPIS